MILSDFLKTLLSILTIILAQSTVLIVFIKALNDKQEKHFNEKLEEQAKYLNQNYHKLADVLNNLKLDFDKLKLEIVGEYIKKGDVKDVWLTLKDLEKRVIRLEERK